MERAEAENLIKDLFDKKFAEKFKEASDTIELSKCMESYSIETFNLSDITATLDKVEKDLKVCDIQVAYQKDKLIKISSVIKSLDKPNIIKSMTDIDHLRYDNLMKKLKEMPSINYKSGAPSPKKARFY